jgi:hypothetical protein
MPDLPVWSTFEPGVATLATMDQETRRKRPTPARDSLKILRRVEPALLRMAGDVVALHQTAQALSEQTDRPLLLEQSRLLEQLVAAQQQLADNQERLLDNQKALMAQFRQLEQRAGSQSRGLKALRKDLKFLPVLWSLAALVFALAGAATTILRLQLP